MHNPPQSVIDQGNRMPRRSYALFVVLNDKAENAEFCVWGKEDFLVEWWKWRKSRPGNIKGKRVEYWAKMDHDYIRVNPDAV
jgi:hypothetical protein